MKIFNRKIKRRWTIVIIIIILVIGYFVIKPFLKITTEGYVIEKIDKGDVLQIVSETGSVQAADNISLGFKSIGKIQSINVNVGDEVVKGQVLASIDTDQLNTQLKNAKAQLIIAQSQYEKLMNGYTPEDIKTYKDDVELAKQNLKSSYESLVNILDDANIKIYNTSSFVNFLKKSYFERGDAESITVSDSKFKIDSEFYKFTSLIKEIKLGLNEETIVSEIDKVKESILEIKTSLEKIRDIVDPTKSYQGIISSSEKELLDAHITYINSSLTSITSSQQTISSLKIALKKAENTLALRQANPRQEDIDIYLAQIRQAEANVSLYQTQIEDARIKSPIDGKITKINAKIGEVVSMNQPVISLLSLNPFQIKADIYEQDIVKVKIDNPVEVTLIAFPGQPFLGKVISIAPAEKIIDQVVYYEVTIDFPNEIEGIRSGMTADIIIHTNKKENVLRVPKNALEVIDGAEIVQIARNGKIEKRQIVVGLEGDDYYEVVSGLNEGDKVIIGKKQ